MFGHTAFGHIMFGHTAFGHIMFGHIAFRHTRSVRANVAQSRTKWDDYMFCLFVCLSETIFLSFECIFLI